MRVSGVVVWNRVSSQQLCRMENGCFGSGLTAELIKVCPYAAVLMACFLISTVTARDVSDRYQLATRLALFAGRLFFFSNELTSFHVYVSKNVLSCLSSVGEHTPETLLTSYAFL